MGEVMIRRTMTMRMRMKNSTSQFKVDHLASISSFSSDTLLHAIT